MPMEPMTEDLEMSALDHWEDIIERIVGGDPVVFLNYDGTLTPIVDVPSQAVISDSMRGTLHRLALLCPVLLVSSRDVHDLRTRVGLNELYYVGSHGHEVLGPYGQYVEDQGEMYLPSLDRAEEELRYDIGHIRGALVERRRFNVALHYRLVDRQNLPGVMAVFEKIARRHPDLKVTTGKMVFELCPDTGWNKGNVVDPIISVLGIVKTAVPLYIGDDITDEDAFKAIGDRGITILVNDGERETAAQYRLTDHLEVQQLLEQLTEALEAIQERA